MKTITTEITLANIIVIDFASACLSWANLTLYLIKK